jgi:hypothetical protein
METRMMNKNSAITRILASAMAAAVCLSAGSAYAASTPITIVNNLDQPLLFKKIQNRQSVKIVTSPPQEILAHSSGSFKIAVGSSGGNEHLDINYAVKDTDSSVGIVYKYEKLTFGKKRCSTEVPNWVTGSVKNCGNYDSKNWKYTFDPVQQPAQ